MYLLLDTPVPVGGLDSEPYTTLSIENIWASKTGKIWKFNVRLGYVNGESDYVPGKASQDELFKLVDSQFAQLMDFPALAAGEKLKSILQRAMYAAVQLLRPEYAGSVVA